MNPSKWLDGFAQCDGPRSQGLREITIATLIALAIIAAFLPVGYRIASAYQNTSDSWTSLSCPFSGSTAAYSSSASSYTFRSNSCATYAMTYLDYKSSGSWYGPYYDYEYRNYTWIANVWFQVDATDTYSGHQIYVSGSWRQVENLINFDW